MQVKSFDPNFNPSSLPEESQETSADENQSLLGQFLTKNELTDQEVMDYLFIGISAAFIVNDHVAARDDGKFLAHRLTESAAKTISSYVSNIMSERAKLIAELKNLKKNHE